VIRTSSLFKKIKDKTNKACMWGAPASREGSILLSFILGVQLGCSMNVSGLIKHPFKATYWFLR
jgi:hypothetical protein